MANTGPEAPGTVADLGSTWSSLDNVKVEDGSYAASTGASLPLSQYYTIVQLVYDGSPIGSNQGGPSVGLPSSNSFVSVGSDSSTWGASLTAAQVNSSSFGVDIRIYHDVETSTFRSTNFGFAVPSGATINGVLCRIKGYLYISRLVGTPRVDFVELTVHYTEGGGGGTISQAVRSMHYFKQGRQ